MADENISTVEIQLDIGEATVDATELSNILKGLQDTAKETGSMFEKAFTAVLRVFKNIQSEANAVSNACSKLTGALSAVQSSAKMPQDTGGWFDGIKAGYETVIGFCDGIEKMEKNSGKLYNVFADIATAPNLSGLLTSMFPKTTELADAVGDWAKGDLAETVKKVMTSGGALIGGSAESIFTPIVDFFKGKGQLIGESMSTMFSGVSTAFQGISSAFSGMSLGWGAAIAAIVTLIVLLITNWDSVKAAILTAWETIKSALATAAEWINTTVIQPIIAFFEPVIAWFSELFQGIWQLISDVVNNVVSFITSCVQIIFAIWATIGAWFYQNVIQPVADFFIELWTTVSTWATDAWNGIVDVFVGVGSWFYQNVIQPVGKFFSGLWDGICNAATSAWDFLVGIWESIKEVFGKVWSWFQETILDPLVNGFKGMVNGVIGFINGLIGGIINGINWIIRAINKIQFTVPDWVPGLGGMTLGFNLKELTAPQIPYLAKGAVLPANRPFLAVVGDQRHGTNVEAPLATIQEAVGLVMNDHINAMMAGFRALLEEQQATRRTIEGIEIGDRVIGEAAQRYQRKMAVTYGTF